MTTPELRSVVGRLQAAYRAGGLPPVRPPADDIEEVLQTIRDEIAPLRLPADLEQFWRLVDPRTVSVAPHPELTSADFALRCWLSHRDEFPGTTPRLLFPVAYTSHQFLFVELDDGEGAGAILQWAYAGSPFSVRSPSFLSHLDLLTTFIEDGEYRQHDAPHVWTEFDPHGRWGDAQAARLAASLPLPRLGTKTELVEDVLSWPDHWLASDGLTAEGRALRGATTTVRELLAGSAVGVATWTIRARPQALAGSGAGLRASMDDGTGLLDVWFPAAVCTYGPVLGEEFEVDLVLPQLPAAGETSDDLVTWLSGSGAMAEATAVRPVL